MRRSPTIRIPARRAGWASPPASQGAGNGSGYLAIVYAGEVRLYRTDDTGSLSFTMLAAASAPIGTAPRRLRLESEGNTHRVYFNGTLMLTHIATGTIYSSGQPGIAASVFGGPQVMILSFEGRSLAGARSMRCLHCDPTGSPRPRCRPGRRR